jgi:hypothetical protein
VITGRIPRRTWILPTGKPFVIGSTCYSLT